jgi:putative transposase
MSAMSKAKPSKSSERQKTLGLTTRVLRLRIKDRHAPFLLRQSREVNMVWNYSQEISLKVLERERRFMSGYDMAAFTKGATKEGLSLHSQTVQAVSEEYCTRRKQFKKAKLRWRASWGSRRALGWIPVKASAISYRAGQVHYQGKALSLWDSYGLADYTLRSGNFSEDARGRWYLNVTVDVKRPAPPARAPEDTGSLGVDLGLNDLAGFSDPALENVEAQRFYRDLEPALAVSQRAGNKRRTRAIHAKIANRRKDFLHKLSTRLVKNYGAVFIGDVDSSWLVKTNAAKSVLDASWGALRTQLQYKGDDAGSWVRITNEAYSTQECSCCKARTGPKGRKDLDVRAWVCGSCGAEHDRDRNAAENIRQWGLAALEKELSVAGEAKASSEPVMNELAAAGGLGHEPLAGGMLIHRSGGEQGLAP